MVDSDWSLDSSLDFFAFAFSMDCHDFANAKSRNDDKIDFHLLQILDSLPLWVGAWLGVHFIDSRNYCHKH